METTTPKVHQSRHHRSSSRHRQREQQQRRRAAATAEQRNDVADGRADNEDDTDRAATAAAAVNPSVAVQGRQHSSDGQDTITDATCAGGGGGSTTATTTTTTTTTTSTSQTSQRTVLLVNGHAPPSLDHETADEAEEDQAAGAPPTVAAGGDGTTSAAGQPPPHLESPTQQQPGSSRNSSGDALSLRETLQQLPVALGGSAGRSRHHHRRNHSPQTQETLDSSFHRGILGFVDRELKQSSPTPSALSASGASGGSGTVRKLQSLSDPTASPAQRSIRSRSSLERSPRRKRSKSESRRRRERKLIAAGEMEVRQANETLMRYLKQCTEMNDASLSGELEIDQSYDERRVHRKTKSQRDKRGHLISKLYAAGGLSSLLKELSDDIVPAEGEEIYNPFTPVVSPTDDMPTHIDKMFLQTSSGYRPVEHGYYKHHHHSHHRPFAAAALAAGGHSTVNGGDVDVEGRYGGVGTPAGGGAVGGRLLRVGSSYSDTHCLLAAEYERSEISTNIQLACVLQRLWLLLANMCHGLLAGLALAHLLLVLTSHPLDWQVIAGGGSSGLAGAETKLADESTLGHAARQLNATMAAGAGAGGAIGQPSLLVSTMLGSYASFAEVYLNTFYCLAILCLVSVFDRMDICRWQLSNAVELISFRWLIIAMVYIATIILTICSTTLDEHLYYDNGANVTIAQNELLSQRLLNLWNSLAVTRSIGAICGWLLIGITPQEDLLYEHLVDLTRYQYQTNN